MTLEEEVKNMIKKADSLLEENKDLSGEDWFRWLKDSKKTLEFVLMELERKRFEDLKKFFEDVRTLVRNQGKSNMINKDELNRLVERLKE